MNYEINEKNELSFVNKRTSNLILPSNVEKVADYVAPSNKRLKSIEFNEGLKEIGDHAFIGCKNLKNIMLSSSIEKIDKFAFTCCKSLKEVVLPNKVKEISRSLFADCKKLKKVTLPSSLEAIGSMAFCNCHKLYDIEIPNSVYLIGESSFENCSNLYNINLPDSIKKISSKTFNGCSVLEYLKLPSKLETIEDSAFSKCLSLKEIVIPNSVTYIGNSCFMNNTNLRKVVLPLSLMELSDDTFISCSALESIDIPSKVNRIGNNCFLYCFDLKRVNLNDNLKVIGKSAFGLCKGIKEIDFPKSLKKIEEEAFHGCDLKKIIIPDSVEYINCNAFKENYHIEEISLPKNVMIDIDIFEKLRYLKKLSLYNPNNLLETNIREFIKKNNEDIYFDKETKQILIYKNGFKEELNENLEKIDYSKYKEYFNCDDSIAVLLYACLNNKKMNKFKFLSTFINSVSDSENIELLYDIISNTYESIEYNRLMKRIYKDTFNKDDKYFGLFKLARALGSFDKDDIVRQRACNFIENLFDKNLLNIDMCEELFSYLEYGEYNEEWAKFVMKDNNFSLLVQNNNETPDFFARTYNEYSGIMELNRKHKGHGAYRNITIEACKKYLNEIPFINVTEETMDIVPYVYMYTRNQYTFDKVKKIREEYIKMRNNNEINDHILNEELKEETYFESIEKIKNNILEDSKEILNNLNNKANKDFTYEFLSKYDPRNFVLGMYCTCCSTIERVGYGIMKASVIHPDCQNLIIKNKKGEIIAKSTLYVNREQGYAVFNNVEVSDYVARKDKIHIYNKYKQAVNDFANRYNEINKEKPIRQINVGMDINDLGPEIRKNNPKGEILEGIDFSQYGDLGMSYKGDWYDDQCVIWKK